MHICVKYNGFQSTHGGFAANVFNLHRHKRFCKSSQRRESTDMYGVVRMSTEPYGELPRPRPVQAAIRLRWQTGGELVCRQINTGNGTHSKDPIPDSAEKPAQGAACAAPEVHNALRPRDVRTVVGIIHTRSPSIGDGAASSAQAVRAIIAVRVQY